MTTYPLSEPATAYRGEEQGAASNQNKDIVAQGTLSDCVEVLEGWSKEDRASVRIDIDGMNLRYGPDEVEELLEYLRQEGKG